MYARIRNSPQFQTALQALKEKELSYADMRFISSLLLDRTLHASPTAAADLEALKELAGKAYFYDIGQTPPPSPYVEWQKQAYLTPLVKTSPTVMDALLGRDFIPQRPFTTAELQQTARAFKDAAIIGITSSTPAIKAASLMVHFVCNAYLKEAIGGQDLIGCVAALLLDVGEKKNPERQSLGRSVLLAGIALDRAQSGSDSAQDQNSAAQICEAQILATLQTENLIQNSSLPFHTLADSFALSSHSNFQPTTNRHSNLRPTINRLKKAADKTPLIAASLFKAEADNIPFAAQSTLKNSYNSIAHSLISGAPEYKGDNDNERSTPCVAQLEKLLNEHAAEHYLQFSEEVSKYLLVHYQGVLNTANSAQETAMGWREVEQICDASFDLVCAVGLLVGSREVIKVTYVMQPLCTIGFISRQIAAKKRSLFSANTLKALSGNLLSLVQAVMEWFTPEDPMFQRIVDQLDQISQDLRTGLAVIDQKLNLILAAADHLRTDIAAVKLMILSIQQTLQNQAATAVDNSSIDAKNALVNTVTQCSQANFTTSLAAFYEYACVNSINTSGRWQTSHVEPLTIGDWNRKLHGNRRVSLSTPAKGEFYPLEYLGVIISQAILASASLNFQSADKNVLEAFSHRLEKIPNPVVWQQGFACYLEAYARYRPTLNSSDQNLSQTRITKCVTFGTDIQAALSQIPGVVKILEGQLNTISQALQRRIANLHTEFLSDLRMESLTAEQLFLGIEMPDIHRLTVCPNFLQQGEKSLATYLLSYFTPNLLGALRSLCPDYIGFMGVEEQPHKMGIYCSRLQYTLAGIGVRNAVVTALYPNPNPSNPSAGRRAGPVIARGAQGAYVQVERGSSNQFFGQRLEGRAVIIDQWLLMNTGLAVHLHQNSWRAWQAQLRQDPTFTCTPSAFNTYYDFEFDLFNNHLHDLRQTLGKQVREDEAINTYAEEWCFLAQLSTLLRGYYHHAHTDHVQETLQVHVPAITGAEMVNILVDRVFNQWHSDYLSTTSTDPNTGIVSAHKRRTPKKDNEALTDLNMKTHRVLRQQLQGFRCLYRLPAESFRKQPRHLLPLVSSTLAVAYHYFPQLTPKPTPTRTRTLPTISKHRPKSKLRKSLETVGLRDTAVGALGLLAMTGMWISGYSKTDIKKMGKATGAAMTVTTVSSLVYDQRAEIRRGLSAVATTIGSLLYRPTSVVATGAQRSSTPKPPDNSDSKEP